jgi:hypothetical protein
MATRVVVVYRREAPQKLIRISVQYDPAPVLPPKRIVLAKTATCNKKVK